MNEDFPCMWGHPKKVHFWNGGITGSCHLTKSGEVINSSRGADYVDRCIEYKPDNLRYLEEMSR
jgi:hypothetical protein